MDRGEVEEDNECREGYLDDAAIDAHQSEKIRKEYNCLAIELKMQTYRFNRFFTANQET